MISITIYWIVLEVFVLKIDTHTHISEPVTSFIVLQFPYFINDQKTVCEQDMKVTSAALIRAFSDTTAFPQFHLSDLINENSHEAWLQFHNFNA